MADQLMPGLYDKLVSLCSMNESFYWKDVYLDSIKYRIFSFRLGSYKIFHSDPCASNCRGIMFNINDPANIQLVSLPTEKFYNYEEGPGPEQHELGQFGHQMEKVDGWFISTFLHVNQNNEQILRLKTKISIQSAQIDEAMQLLTDELKKEIKDLAADYTINLEYTSPSNRVVVHYSQPQLTITSIRSHSNGDTIFASDLKSFLAEKGCQTMLKHVVQFKSISEGLSQKEFVNRVRQETEGEGYVVEIIHPNRPRYLVKIKTHKYVLAYQSKETIKSSQALFRSIIKEQSDDLRSLFHDDRLALKQIADMEEEVMPIFNRMIQFVEQFYDKNKHLSKENYVNLVRNTSNINHYMPLLMNLYEGKSVDYKQFALDHAHLFGINAQTSSENQENNE